MFNKILTVALLVTSCVNASLNKIEVITNNDNSKNLVVDNWIVLEGNNTQKTFSEYTTEDNKWTIIDNNVNQICNAQKKQNFKLLTLSVNKNNNKQSTTNLILSGIGNIAKKIAIKKATNEISNIILSDNAISITTNYATKAIDLFAGTKYNKMINDAKKPSIFNYFWKNKSQRKLENIINNNLTIGVNFCVNYVTKKLF